jgi:flagellar FliJ protein
MAKRFRFRLEPVLRLRQQKADEAKRVVAERLRRVAAVQREIGLLQQRIEEQVEAMRAGPLVGALDVGQLARHRHWLSHLQRGLLDAMARVRALEAELARERAGLAEAMKRIRILETLKRRQEERYYEALNREEIAEADELSVQRYVHARLAER